jgi:capsid protein
MSKIALIICGGRESNKELDDQIISYVNVLPKNSILINGMANGVDKTAKDNFNGKVEKYYPDWNAFGKSTGTRRNKQIALRLLELQQEDYQVFVKPFAGRIGTKNMIDTAVSLNIKVHNMKIKETTIKKANH